MDSPDPLAALVIGALTTRSQTLATAESLTGGLIGAALTAVPGASLAYRGGVIAYATDLKHALAGVPTGVLDAHGPVSPQTAAALASGVRTAAGADWGVSSTGVAGPDPQDGHVPGEVWLGLARPDGTSTAVQHHFEGDRRAVREATVLAALGLLSAALADL